jgi:hypothetical protein
LVPKSDPKIEMLAPDVVGELSVASCDVVGASNVNALARVPDTPETTAETL